jgi:hypothetical protein
MDVNFVSTMNIENNFSDGIASFVKAVHGLQKERILIRAGVSQALR